MHQTVDEGVLLAVLYHIAVVVQGLVAGVHHRFRYVADAVPQKIDGYHRNGVPLFLSRLLYILFRIVLCGKVAAETKRFRVKPRLLQLYEHQTYGAVILLHLCGKVYTEHRQLVTRDVGVLVPAHLYADHLLFEQGGQHGLGDALVFHQKFEHRVVYRVGHGYLHVFSSIGLILRQR